MRGKKRHKEHKAEGSVQTKDSRFRSSMCPLCSLWLLRQSLAYPPIELAMRGRNMRTVVPLPNSLSIEIWPPERDTI